MVLASFLNALPITDLLGAMATTFTILGSDNFFSAVKETPVAFVCLDKSKAERSAQPVIKIVNYILCSLFHLKSFFLPLLIMQPLNSSSTQVNAK